MDFGCSVLGSQNCRRTSIFPQLALLYTFVICLQGFLLQPQFLTGGFTSHRQWLAHLYATCVTSPLMLSPSTVGHVSWLLHSTVVYVDCCAVIIKRMRGSGAIDFLAVCTKWVSCNNLSDHAPWSLGANLYIWTSEWLMLCMSWNLGCCRCYEVMHVCHHII